jgi:hypothetical protein
MFTAGAPYAEIAVCLAVITISALFGFMPTSRLRVFLIATWCLTPLWLSFWITANYAKQIEFEFGAWWFVLLYSPVFLAFWAVLTVLPFKLVTRAREIGRGTF